MNTLTKETIKQSLLSGKYNTIRVKQVKVGQRWINKETETDTFDKEQRERFLSRDTLRFFRNLGGTETVKRGSFKGIDATINISTSPCKTERKVTYFL